MFVDVNVAREYFDRLPLMVNIEYMLKCKPDSAAHQPVCSWQVTMGIDRSKCGAEQDQQSAC